MKFETKSAPIGNIEQSGINQIEIKAALDSIAAQTKEAVAKYEAQIAAYGEASAATKAEVKALNDKMVELNLAMTELAQKHTAMTVEPAPASVGQAFVASEQYKSLSSNQSQRARIEIKNTVISDATATTFPMQQPGVIAGAFAPKTIRALFRSIPVSTNMVAAIRELLWTNAAAETAQAAAKPESTLTFEQFNVPIETVAHFLKISNQLLADAPAIAAYIDIRLRDGLDSRIDKQLLIGDGTAPNLSGLTASGNFTAYAPTSGDNLADAINRAKYQLWAVGVVPDSAIVNPADWGAMERMRESAGSGKYLYGPPGFPAAMNPFGVDIVLSQHMPAGSFWIGDRAKVAVIYNRTGTTIEMGYVNDDFTKNLITIRGEERLGFGVEAPWAAHYGPITTA